MKSSKQLTKRGFSPIAQKNTEVSDRKKKSASNYNQINYKQKEFEPYGKSDKKRSTNYLKDLLKKPQSVNKYRIVTQPVDDRVMTIVSSSFVPSKSRGKVEHQHSANKVRQVSFPRHQTTCPNCQQYVEEITQLKSQIAKIISQKSQWKNGQINLDQLKAVWGLGSPKTRTKSSMNQHKDNLSMDIKKHIYDLMRDIQSLTEIDYPKMLALKIFKYNPPIEINKNNEQIEIKSLLGQLRNHYEGRLNQWDLEDETEQSDHVKAILRNIRARLSHYLRQNLQLKAKTAILQKAQQMSAESQQYLRLIIEDVLRTYTSKI